MPTDKQLKILEQLNKGMILEQNRSVPSWGGGCWVQNPFPDGAFTREKINLNTFFCLRHNGYLKLIPEKPRQRLSEDYYTLSEKGKALLCAQKKQ